MKQGSNRRPRSRGNQNKPRSGGRNSYDSNGPAGKVRGTAQQVLDKYQALGRDAASSGDRIAAESFFQFAEHYYRIVNADNAGNPSERRERQNADQPQPDTSGNVIEVPVVDGNATAETPDAASESGERNSFDPADEPDADVQATPVQEEPEAPKTPRRRRSRAKAETPAEPAEA